MSEMKLYQALQKIQSELKAPKSNFNSFGKYYYRSCEDILEAVKPLLEKYNVSLTVSDRIECIGDRIYVVATATLLNSEETIAVCGYAREPESKKGMDESQITGATSSYARKYALNGLFSIDDTKDIDTIDADSKLITKEQLNTFKVLGIDIPKVCSHFGVNNVNSLTYAQAKQAIDIKNKK